MNTHIPDAIQGNPVLAETVKTANDWLSDVLGESSPNVDVEWSLGREDPHRPLILLKLTDPFAGSISTEFGRVSSNKNIRRDPASIVSGAICFKIGPASGFNALPRRS